jgi:type II secretory ATPase GspE/PulE/Tfp pilus assembly ATPase PilB-like protein
MILEGSNASQIKKRAIEEGMIPLIKDGMLKVKENITTPAEVLRNAYTTE